MGEIIELIAKEKNNDQKHNNFSVLKLKVEALLFAAEESVEISQFRSALKEYSLAEIKLAIKDLNNEYENRAFHIVDLEGKYQIQTKPEFSGLLRSFFQSSPKTLSKSALETLAIIAYKQPVTRSEINSIRNVDSSSIILNLKEKELIQVSGTRKELGNPMEYKTTDKFLEIFGIKSLEELINLRSLQITKAAQEEIAVAVSTINVPDEEILSKDLAFSDE